MKITLSIVSHGQRDIALRMLEDILRLSPPDVAEIIYTANIPERDLPALNMGHIRLVVIRNETPKGFGSNHNTAFSHCRTPYFCVMNPDLRFDADPFPALLQDLTGTPKRGLVAPRIYSPEGELANTARKLYTPRELIRQKLHPVNHGDHPDWLAGMFLLFNSRAYNEGYFLYIEDVDICSRLCLAGWSLAQVADTRVVHDARKQSHRSLRFTRWHIGGMLRYWTRTCFWRYGWQLWRERRR